ncbi:MAG: hypothetical protein QOD46_1285, partial [Actinomycetota bacterium]|nr:hypothetical protein [Actinomycetota bacterium]
MLPEVGAGQPLGSGATHGVTAPRQAPLLSEAMLPDRMAPAPERTPHILRRLKKAYPDAR